MPVFWEWFNRMMRAQQFVPFAPKRSQRQRRKHRRQMAR